MITRMRKGLLAPLLMCLMTACGGGGGGSSDTPTTPSTGNKPPATTTPLTTTPTAEDIANARSSELTANLIADTNELTITWKDTFAAETGYTVEAQAADGTWEVVDSRGAGPGTGIVYRYQRVISASGIYRVQATRDSYSVPLEMSADVSQIAVDLDHQMSIELDPAPPVSGSVQLSTANAVNAQSVTYYVDTRTIDTSTTGPDFALNWNSGAFTDGEHLLQATVRLNSGVNVDLRRTIMVDNPAIAVSLDVLSRDFGNSVTFAGLATADVGVHQLEFFANGAPVRVTPASGQTRFNFDFHIDKDELPGDGGTVTFRVVATDTAGVTAEATDQFFIDKTPKLTLTTPANGAIVRDTLRLVGTFSEDVSTATVTARLGDVVIMELPPQASGSFDFNYSLAGLPPGEYTLSVHAVDAGFQGKGVTRRVIVPTSQLTYEFVASDVAKLLATDQGAVLYQKTDGSVILRSAAGVETTLPIPSGFHSVNDWQLDGGYVVMTGVLASHTYHIYAFTPTGQVKNLSLQTGSEMNSTPRLKSPWVTWYTSGTNADQYHVYNLTTDALTVVPHPAGLYSLSSDVAMVTTPGAEHLFFTGWSGVTDRNDVFRYDLQTQTTDMLTAGEAQHTYVQTDNTRLALLRGLWGSYELFTAPVTNATALTSLGPTLNAVPKLRDGLVVWNTASGIKANDGTSTMNVGSAGTVYSVADGRVLFNESPPKLLSWSAAGGKQMLLNNLPVSALHDGNSAFITTGSSDSMLLYRITLP